MNEPKKLYRLDHGMLAGVCGGVAEYFAMDPKVVRVIWAALALFGPDCGAGSAGEGQSMKEQKESIR